jgi:hypothetical protein
MEPAYPSHPGMWRRTFWILTFFLAGALAVVDVQSARAQSASSGTVAGTVTDTSGAAVPGATITLINVATGSTRTTKSSNTGQYVFAYVDPGTYNVKVEKQGFKTVVVSNQVVRVGTQLTVNAVLQVGEVSTTVMVTSSPGAELQTLNATVGTTISGTTMINLPNISRDASTLAVLEPGQNINGNVGGAASDQNSFQVDGGYATDDMSGDNNTYIPSFASDTAGGVGAYHSSGYNQAPSAVIPIPVTSIEEVKVNTANQTADFNGGAGSQVQVVTRRGTNTFHGGAYEYYLDTTFGGANTWDNNRLHIPLPSSHFNRFGAYAGGRIPHSRFLGGDWYIFGNYEGYRNPQSSIFERNFPLPSLRAGIIHLNGKTINLNPFPVVDPGCGPAVAGCKVTTTGQVIQPTPCPQSPNGLCDPRGYGTTLNGQAGGPPNPVIQLWNTYLPLPTDCGSGDGLNYCGYPGVIRTPKTSNFFVTRIDHDFAKNQHFNATYHYYHLKNTVADQWDIGGFFPGDVKGQYAALRQKPQVAWLYTVGLTTDVSPNVTNDFHFSYTRNYWAYMDPSGVPNVAGYPAALEVGGETSNPFGPYNTNNQSTRTRFWNGHDFMVRDDVTWVKGNHLFQFGGQYLLNNLTHRRNDNGETVNTFQQYLIGLGNGVSLGSVGINMANYIPAGISSINKYGNLYSMVLGMVDETQILYTRKVGSVAVGLPLAPFISCAIPGVPATSACVRSPDIVNESMMPTYNGYFTDSWRIGSSFTLNYGLGYTVEMPPYETRGGYQSVLVDQNGEILYAQQYLQNVKQAALQGIGYAPALGFAAIRNVKGHSHYPYDPFYGGISPRVGFAWSFRPDTVLRAGYARIYGRINGVDPVLAELLTPGLMQPATCGGPNIFGGCGGDPSNVFRVGIDGTKAPLPQASPSLPQPWYPGLNDVATGPGEGLDPNFKPNNSDEFTLSIQHQFGPRILAEVGYIGRLIHNELQYYSLTAVPYMITAGGQTFANAWANVMVATNYGTNLNNIPVQPFFEAALLPSYCAGFPNCTTAFVMNNGINGNGLMTISDAFDAWAAISNAGMWRFGRTLTSDPYSSPFGAAGMSPSYLTTVSNGYGNYNAGYLQLTINGWRGLTMKTNFTWSKALGTGTVVQATSSYASVDNWNLHNMYGPQYYDETFHFNFFINYEVPFFKSQQGVLGRILGGWSISPLFVAGSGFPIELNTAAGDCGSTGECNPSYVGTFENMIITQNIHYSNTRHQNTYGSNCGYAGPGQNVFANPDAACPVNGGIFGDPFRNPILGYDGQIGGGGPLRGLPFWNMDLGITKKIKMTERVSTSLYFNFQNVFNHMQPADPCFNAYDLSTWGVLGCGGNVQANSPRRLQIGASIDW